MFKKNQYRFEFFTVFNVILNIKLLNYLIKIFRIKVQIDDFFFFFRIQINNIKKAFPTLPTFLPP